MSTIPERALRGAIHVGGDQETFRGPDLKKAVEVHERLPHRGLVHLEKVRPNSELSGLEPDVQQMVLERKNALDDALLKATMRHP